MSSLQAKSFATVGLAVLYMQEYIHMNIRNSIVSMQHAIFVQNVHFFNTGMECCRTLNFVVVSALKESSSTKSRCCQLN